MTDQAAIDERLRPSNLYKVAGCAGSAAAEAGVADPGSVYAAEGSVAHYLAALSFDAKSWPALRKVYAYKDFRWIEEGKPDYIIPVDQTMLDAVDSYREYVLALCDKGTAPMVEKTLDLRGILPKDGHVDAAVLTSLSLDVVDLKYGAGKRVYATDNLQLATYALGVVRDVENETLCDFPDEWPVNLHIYQPRKGGADVWRVNVGYLRQAVEPFVRSIVAKAREPDAPRTPGDHCTFCLVRDTCEARRKDIDVAVTLLPARQDLAMLEASYARVAHIRSWCNEVEKALLSQLVGGATGSRYKVVQGDGRRSWKDEGQATRLAAHWMDADVYAPRELRSVAQLEQAIGKKEFTLLGFPLLVDKTPTAPQLAPIVDPRPAVQGTTADEFPHIDNQ